MFGLSESFFQGSPFHNSSSDTSFGAEWRKKNNLNQKTQSRTFSPGSRLVKSPNFSPIVKQMNNFTIAEESDDAATSNKTFIVVDHVESPQTPINTTYVIDHKLKKKNVGAAEAQKFLDRKNAHKRRTMFMLPATPTTVIGNGKLNASDFEHKFTVDTILKEIGMKKYIDLFESEEVRTRF